MLNKTTIMGVCLSLISFTANAVEHHDKPTNHAPLGVMGDHTHEEGEWMFSYRYSFMQMDGNRDGTNNISAAATRAAGFMVAPLEMNMEMHMFGAMYGLTDDITIMAMAPFARKSMNHETGGGVKFKTTTEGFSDTKISALHTIYEEGNQNIHLNYGVSLPTGSVNERYDTPAMNNAKLPYPMQLGSGTYDPLLGITYNNHGEEWSWGAQASTVLRFGENSQDYRLGNEYNLTAWVAKDLSKNASVSFRLDGKSWSDIKGADPQLNPAMVPTARTDLRGGKRVDALIGVNLLGDSGALDGHRLAIEYGMPIYENLDGPQLSTEHRLMVGWQKSL